MIVLLPWMASNGREEHNSFNSHADLSHLSLFQDGGRIPPVTSPRAACKRSIRVCLHSDFNNSAFRHWVIFSRKGAPPPLSSKMLVRLCWGSSVLHVTSTNPQTFGFEFHLKS